MAHIRTVTIEEAVSKLIDYRGKTPRKSSSGIRLMTAKVVKGGRIIEGREEFIAEDYYDEWMRRGLPQQWDILITMEAPLGEVAMLRTTEKVALGQRLVLLRGNPNVVDQKYFFYALQSPHVTAELAARATGTTVLGIKQSELRQVRLPVFPLPTQRRIAAILSAYDDLIENNTRRIAILEEMARRLYEEWFIHFRFPGHEGVRMVESEIGPVPQGWDIASLAEIAAVNAESIGTKNAPSVIQYIDIKSVSTGCVESVREVPFSSAPSRARRVVRSGDIIWSSVRPNLRAYAPILDPRQNTIASTGFAVITPTRVPFSYLYPAVTTDAFVEYLVNHATGSAYPAVNQKDFEVAKLVLPPNKLLTSYDQIVQPMFLFAHRLGLKNANLRVQRDLLLPKLVSGEIDVSVLDRRRSTVMAA